MDVGLCLFSAFVFLLEGLAFLMIGVDKLSWHDFNGDAKGIVITLLWLIPVEVIVVGAIVLTIMSAVYEAGGGSF